MTQQSTPEQTLSKIGVELPQLPMPGGNYLSAKRVGEVIYLAGAISSGPGGVITGTAGAGSSVEQGYAAARACTLTQLAVLKRELGSLDRVAEVISVNGYVNAVSGFAESPAIINGASDLLVEVFGEAGRHVRALLEIQMTVRVKAS